MSGNCKANSGSKVANEILYPLKRERENGEKREINFIPWYGYVGKIEVASEMLSVMDMEMGNEMKSSMEV